MREVKLLRPCFCARRRHLRTVQTEQSKVEAIWLSFKPEAACSLICKRI
jgi:hypothetical protein